jgi:hypothetical protein
VPALPSQGSQVLSVDGDHKRDYLGAGLAAMRRLGKMCTQRSAADDKAGSQNSLHSLGLGLQSDGSLKSSASTVMNAASGMIPQSLGPLQLRAGGRAPGRVLNPSAESDITIQTLAMSPFQKPLEAAPSKQAADANASLDVSASSANQTSLAWDGFSIDGALTRPDRQRAATAGASERAAQGPYRDHGLPRTKTISVGTWGHHTPL